MSGIGFRRFMVDAIMTPQVRGLKKLSGPANFWLQHCRLAGKDVMISCLPNHPVFPIILSLIREQTIWGERLARHSSLI
jgi:hypothetical protein